MYFLFEDDVRVLKSLLRASKHCLGASLPPRVIRADLMTDQRQLVLAERVVERAAAYEERVGAAERYHSSEVPARFQQLSKEYYTLRITLVRTRCCILRLLC